MAGSIRRGRIAPWFAAWCIAACLGGCSVTPLPEAAQAKFYGGADGDREVAVGPGMFSGEKGGWEFDPLAILHSRALARSGERRLEEGPE